MRAPGEKEHIFDPIRFFSCYSQNYIITSLALLRPTFYSRLISWPAGRNFKDAVVLPRGCTILGRTEVEAIF